MKVSDLIKMLQKHDPNEEVLIENPTHDHWNTNVAVEVWDVEKVHTQWSDYHEAEKILKDDPGDVEGARVRLVLRCP